GDTGPPVDGARAIGDGVEGNESADGAAGRDRSSENPRRALSGDPLLGLGLHGELLPGSLVRSVADERLAEQKEATGRKPRALGGTARTRRGPRTRRRVREGRRSRRKARPHLGQPRVVQPALRPV